MTNLYIDSYPIKSTADTPIEQKTSSKAPLEKTSLSERTDEAAQKVFKNLGFFSTIGNFFYRIFKWIKDIPSKIAKAIDRCLDDNDSEEVETEALDFNDPKPALLTSTFKPQTVEESAKSMDSKTFETMINDTVIKADSLKNKIDRLEFKKIEDLKTLNTISNEIETQKKLLSKIENHIKLEDWLKKINESKAKFDGLNVALNAKKEKKYYQIVRLQQELEDLGETPEKIIHEPKPAQNQGRPIEEHELAIRNREAPPSLNNSDRLNSCYRNSIIELLWTLDLSKYIVDIPKKRQVLNDEYNREMKWYEDDCLKYKEQLKQYEAYLTYQADKEKYKKQKELNDKKLREYEKDLKKWETTNKNPANKPNEPILEKLTPPTEVPFKKKPEEVKPPFNKVFLLDALLDFAKVSESGSIKAIRTAAASIHEIVGNIKNQFKLKNQECAAEFLLVILDLIGEPFELCKLRTGINELKDFSMLNSAPEKMLTVNFPNHLAKTASLSELIDHVTSPPQGNSDSAIPLTKKNDSNEIETKFVNKYNEKMYISGKPPKHLFLHLVRFTSNLSKIETELTIPKNLVVNLSNLFIANDNNVKKYDYRLIGFSLHSGNLGSGHYTADVLTKDKWYHANDWGASVVGRTTEEVIRDFSKAYVVLLERVNEPEVNTP